MWFSVPFWSENKNLPKGAMPNQITQIDDKAPSLSHVSFV